jgi:Fe-S-cluster-containing dehydrogenase component
VSASFVFDANTCTGCGACRVACTIENGLAPDVSWRRIETFNPQHRSIAPVFHLSLACNHCATAACMNACPALAYRRDEPTGAVLLDSNLCIGCGYCSWACPYDAPVFDQDAGVMTKCTWCADRLQAGLKPACASHCPTGALGYSNVAPAARVIAMTGLPETTLEPSLHVIPLAPGRMQPVMADAGPQPPVPSAPESPRGISLRHEWPLAVFTLGVAVLVGFITAGAAGAVSIPARLFMPAAVGFMGIAGAHLGRKERGYRAVLNVRRSWLSREIVVLSLFVALASAWLLFAPSSTAPGWTAALVGFAGLFCADSVYGVLPGGPGYRHSAGVMLNGALIASVATANVLTAVPLVALKAWMYFRWNEKWCLAPLLTAVRVIAGFAAPVVLLGAGRHSVAAVGCLLVGEALGRGEYYMQLTARTPRREMDAALARGSLN